MLNWRNINLNFFFSLSLIVINKYSRDLSKKFNVYNRQKKKKLYIRIYIYIYIYDKKKKKHKENYKRKGKNSERKFSVDTLRLRRLLRNTKSLGNNLVDQLIAQASIYNLGK